MTSHSIERKRQTAWWYRSLCAAIPYSLTLLGVCVPHASLANHVHDFTLCVTPAGTFPTSACGDPCYLNSSPLLSTIAGALTEAANLPDAPDGTRPSIRICVTGEDYHHENVWVDQTAGRIGAPLTLATDEDTTLCGDSSLPGQPVLRWQTSAGGFSSDQISVRIDLRAAGPCGHTAPGILVVQDTPGGYLTIQDTTILGSTDYAISTLGSAGDISLTIRDSHIVNCEGAALHASGGLSLDRVEVVGCHLRPTDALEHSALIESTATNDFYIHASVFFGNLIDGALLADGELPALVRGPLMTLDRSLLAANVLTTGAPLVEAPLREVFVDIVDAGQVVHDFGLKIERSVIARNRHVQSLLGHSAVLAQPAQWTSTLMSATNQCAALDRLAPYEQRPRPAADAEDSQGPLFVFNGVTDANSGRFLNFGHNFVVDNEVGEGPLILIDSRQAQPSVQILENTFAGNGAARLLELMADQPGSSVVVARNLLDPGVAAAVAEPVIITADPPSTLTVTMNASAAPILWADPLSSIHPIIGPNPVVEFSYQDAATLQSESDCERFKAVCPNFSSLFCQALPWLDLPCAADTALHWLPTSAVADAIGTPWPWQTEFFLTGAGGSAAPGATGGNCAANLVTYDILNNFGDGDGYPDIVDCDNEDSNIQPALPVDDGYSSEYCDVSDAPCYSCPAGTGPRPDPPDEEPLPDEEPPPDEEPSEDEDQPYPGVYHLVHPGCYQGGCGISYDCESSASSESSSATAALILALLPWGMRRKRG